MNWRRLGRKIRFAMYWPGLFIYFLGSRRSRVLLVCADEVLLIRDRTTFFYDEQSWSLPGGGIKRDEEVSTAGVREVREELNVELDSATLIPLGVQTSGSYGLRYQAHFFYVELSAKPAVVVDGHEVQAAQWFTLADVVTLPQKREVAQALALLAEQR